jgi:hypothetical protein
MSNPNPRADLENLKEEDLRNEHYEDDEKDHQEDLESSCVPDYTQRD